MSTLGPKITHFPHFCHYDNFPWKQFQENLMNRFRIKFKKCWFCNRKMSHLTHFVHKKFPQKMAPFTSPIVYWNLTSCKKLKKKNELIYRKFCNRQTDGWKDRAEFIGHFGRGGGTIMPISKQWHVSTNLFYNCISTANNKWWVSHSGKNL